MFCKLCFVTAFVFFCTATSTLANDKKISAKGKFDKSKLFEKLDTDMDGMLSKAEFAKFHEKLSEKIKEKRPETNDAVLDKVLDKLFEKLDTDKDGTISKVEFEKYQADPEQKKLKKKKAAK